MFNRKFGAALSAIVLSICAVALVQPTAALAHHSFAQFDRTKTFKVTGKVKRWDWRNPHAWLYLTVSKPGKPDQEWAFETFSIPELVRFGYTRKNIKPGDTVTVLAYPRKDGKEIGFLVKTYLPDGKVVGMPDELIGAVGVGTTR